MVSSALSVFARIYIMHQIQALRKKIGFVSPELNTMPWDYYIPSLYLMIILKQVNMSINARQRYIENIAYTAYIRMQFSNLHLCTLKLTPMHKISLI